MQSNLKDILLNLSTDSYITARQLAEKLKIGEKTIRIRLKELEDIGRDYGVVIESKPRFGYRLNVQKNGLENLLLAFEQSEGLPDSTEERISYLLAYLINYNDYIKIEQLCDFLCVSRSTLQLAIKKVEDLLIRYNLEIIRKPNYGIKIQGNEFDMRRCIGECFVKRNVLNIENHKSLVEEEAYLANVVVELIQKYEINLSEIALENFITQIWVALKRIQKGHLICLADEEISITDNKERIFLQDVINQISSWKNIHYTEDEKKYIMIYFASRRMLGNAERDENNFVIREEIDRLVLKMLELVNHEFSIELRNNFDIRMSLNQHMVPLDIRIRYNIPIKNPILTEIKENYIFAYTIAKRVSIILNEHYKKDVSEDEVGYIAVILALAIEQKKTNQKKSRILIVCGTGKGSARLLMYKYQQIFGQYLEKIYVCSLYEIRTFDFDKIDYIFTTIPLSMHVPKPVTEIQQFLGNEDIIEIKKVLVQEHMEFLEQYYKQDQFFVDLKGQTKEEIVHEMTLKISQQRQIPKDFYDAVMYREKMAQTDFGNLVAMPHPYKTITNETFVYVGILNKPILWGKHLVQIVFLIAVSDKEDENLQKFYEATTKLLLQKDMIKKVIEEKSFEVLLKMLRQTKYIESN